MIKMTESLPGAPDVRLKLFTFIYALPDYLQLLGSDYHLAALVTYDLPCSVPIPSVLRPTADATNTCGNMVYWYNKY